MDLYSFFCAFTPKKYARIVGLAPISLGSVRRRNATALARLHEHYELATNIYKAYIEDMRLLGVILYHIFVVLGWSFLISKVGSRLLGLKEKVGDNIWLALAYFLTIVLVVSVCWYIYNRKAPAPEQRGKERLARPFRQLLKRSISGRLFFHHPSTPRYGQS